MSNRMTVLVSCCLTAVTMALLVGLLGACAAAADSPEDNAASASHASGSGGASGSSSGAGGALDVSAQSATGGQVGGTIVVKPDQADLAVTDGGMPLPTAAFTATLEGEDVTASVQWQFDRPDIGDVDLDGTFVPTGQVGGLGAVIATLAAAKGEAHASVTITKVVDNVGLTSEETAELDNPSGPSDPDLYISYPYNETVFPLRVLAPEIQWDGGQAPDLYRLQFTEKYYTYVEYFSAAPPSRHLVDQADWEHVGDSGAGAKSDPLKVSLTRFSGGQAYQPIEHTWHIAQGRLRGTVYYWEIPDAAGTGPNGRIVRIKPDSASIDEFFTPGDCWGCHTVSRDGKKLAFQYQSAQGPLYTLDLTASPVAYSDLAPSKPSVGAYIQSAYNDKGDKLLVSGDYQGGSNQATLRIMDAATGQILNPMAMEAHCGEPAWSPDGKKIAGICGGGGNYTFATDPGYLSVADVAADGVTTSNVMTLVSQAGGPGRPAYPSFAPSSEWIAFGRPEGIGSYSYGTGELWLVKSDGSGLTKLATATGDNRSWNPVFAPLRAGGYYWVAFISRRDYGNRMVGTDRQQLWITAIEDPPTASADPSNPPFYMRGQEEGGRSENAYFALDPCKDMGHACTSGVECCNGHCVKEGSSYVCGELSTECSPLGDKCTIAAECCNSGAVCLDGFCDLPPPK